MTELEELIDDLESMYSRVRVLGGRIRKFIPDTLFSIGYDYFELTIDELKIKNK